LGANIFSELTNTIPPLLRENKHHYRPRASVRHHTHARAHLLRDACCAATMQSPISLSSSIPPGREREIFEVLLSNPPLCAAEALALLGTCKEARGVAGLPPSTPCEPSAPLTTAVSRPHL
jgi:hypothetical protein